MKRVVLHRFLPALLCAAMTLGLAACGADEPPSLEMESTGLEELFSASKTAPGEDREITDASSGGPGPDGAADTPSGGQADPEDVSKPAVDPEQAQESLTLLYEIMAWEDDFAGAVAYLGYREQGDPTPLPDWMRENCPGLAEEAPFLLEIPAERILGPGYGDLYCIVPRDEGTVLTVDHVAWVASEYEVGEVTDAVLYRAKCAKPVLIFTNPDPDHALPDVRISLEADSSPYCGWFPNLDEYGWPSIPGAPDAPLLLDFGVWRYVTGLEDPQDWEDPADVRWDPPTAWQLAYTNWVCEGWYLEISWGDSNDPAYEGIVYLYRQPEEGQEQALVYTGIWRMRTGCLQMELTDGMGGLVSGSFPARMDPTGEYLYIEQDRETGVCPPFFGEDQICMDLSLAYG